MSFYGSGPVRSLVVRGPPFPPLSPRKASGNRPEDETGSSYVPLAVRPPRRR
ncbi:uncharacterized protein BDR25DRAFT_304539 [Lindgomyces ingoldianus]|uniref:Uncharacterized protein n=1 Tax=Lindgomyces ingoldianus TaxID=673940 RepID=A0ACB6QRI3_9PLEO|nr:uncharacterized protein BDR25DRAFT_304539 [Lindgomyces ingoldianus]KAF2469472.1 hypothetical protein BDR25DRAFT_304539 [Lindgomyces ingoldianus]